MFIDPWGLAPGDFIEDSRFGLSDEQLEGIYAAIEEREKGYISREYAASVIVSLGGSIERFPAVTVTEENNLITINANIAIIKNEMGPEYESAVINTIKKEWSQTYNNKDFVVNLITRELDDKTSDGVPYANKLYDTIKFNLLNEKGNASTSLGGSISLYYGPVYGLDHDLKKYGLIAAHEFGHAIGALPDVYNMPEYKHIKSIMNRVEQGGVQEVDFAMLVSSDLFRGTSVYRAGGFTAVLERYK